MNITTEKNNLKKELDSITDEHLIKAIKELIIYSKSAKEEAILKPFTKTQVVKRALQSEQDIKKGRLSSLSQLKKEVKSW